MYDLARNIRLLVLDVDGVLTDGSINIDDRGIETKRFNVRDGFALRVWMRFGFDVAVITGRSGMAVRHRMNEIGVTNLRQGVKNKAVELHSVCDRLEIDPQEAAAIGDDLPDLPMLRACGYPMAVGDAAAAVREVVQFTTVRPGGAGAVREAVEHLLIARGLWDEVLAAYDPAE